MKILFGQFFLIICCVFYLIWWWRGFRPDIKVNRVKGINGVLLGITVVFGLAGVIFSLMPVERIAPLKIPALAIIIGGILAYVILLLVTRFLFHRQVTSELFLIVGWTMLEVSVINKMTAGGVVSETGFAAMCAVTAAAFIISMVLYVAYYKMEEVKAFYAAMVPLVTEAVAMTVFVVMMILSYKGF